jgi:hypothetical protein
VSPATVRLGTPDKTGIERHPTFETVLENVTGLKALGKALLFEGHPVGNIHDLVNYSFHQSHRGASVAKQKARLRSKTG